MSYREKKPVIIEGLAAGTGWPSREEGRWSRASLIENYGSRYFLIRFDYHFRHMNVLYFLVKANNKLLRIMARKEIELDYFIL